MDTKIITARIDSDAATFQMATKLPLATLHTVEQVDAFAARLKDEIDEAADQARQALEELNRGMDGEGD